MIRHRTRGIIGAMGVLAVAGALAGCRSKSESPAPSADTWAVVDGRAIMRDDVEKAFRRAEDPNQPRSNEEALTAKLSLLNEMIVQDILLAKARALKIEIPDSELDAAYADAKKNLSDEAYQQELAKRNLTAADMREGLRRELVGAEADRAGSDVEDRRVTTRRSPTSSTPTARSSTSPRTRITSRRSS